MGGCEPNAEYTTIQQGITQAPDGFTLLVCPGVYPENLAATPRNLTVQSMSGAAVTTIDGTGSRVITAGAGADITFVGFTVINGGAGDGAGVHCNNATLGLEDNIVDGHNALNNGGAVYATGCAVLFAGNTFTNNTAGNSGGAAYFTGSSGTVGSSTWDGNTAVEGGALSATGGGLVISNNTFDSNTATNTSENTWGTGSGGGAVWISGNPSLQDNTVSGNHSNYNGGGVWVRNGTGLVSGNTIEDNTCDEDGGGMYTRLSSNLITGNAFEDNTADDDAGGLRVYRGSHTIEDSTFSGNTAGDDGGGLKMSHSSNAVTNCSFEGNSANDAGGGIELDNETAPVTGCTFEGNDADIGGGLHSWRNEGPIMLADNTFTGNTADCGAGIGFDNDIYLITVADSTFEGNNAVDGGAFCIDKRPQKGPDGLIGTADDFYEESNVLVHNSFFIDNDASDDGGAVYVKFGTATFDFVVLHRSDAPTGGGAVSKEDGEIHFSNSILDDNDGSSAWETEDNGVMTFEYTNLTGNAGGYVGAGVSDPVGTAGNTGVASGFVDAASGNYQLTSASACVDAGDPALLDVDGSRADMGAYGGPNGS